MEFLLVLYLKLRKGKGGLSPSHSGVESEGNEGGGVSPHLVVEIEGKKEEGY